MSRLTSSFAHHWLTLLQISKKLCDLKCFPIFIAAARPHTISTTNNNNISSMPTPSSKRLYMRGKSLYHNLCWFKSSYFCGSRPTKRRHRRGSTQSIYNVSHPCGSYLLPAVFILLRKHIWSEGAAQWVMHRFWNFLSLLILFFFFCDKNVHSCNLNTKRKSLYTLFSISCFWSDIVLLSLGRATCAWNVQKPAFAREKLVYATGAENMLTTSTFSKRHCHRDCVPPPKRYGIHFTPGQPSKTVGHALHSRRAYCSQFAVDRQ